MLGSVIYSKGYLGNFHICVKCVSVDARMYAHTVGHDVKSISSSGSWSK